MISLTLFVGLVVLKAKLTQNRPFSIVRDRWREILRKAYEAVGRFWVEHFAKSHFEPGADKKYDYQFRTVAYRERKDKAFAAGRGLSKGQPPVIAGSDTPLVLTGYMRDQMLKNVVIRGFPTRCTVYLYGPAYLGMHFKMRQPDKPKEITRVTSDQKKVLSAVLRDNIAAGIRSVQGTRVSGEAA
jgi:hypothetical protein